VLCRLVLHIFLFPQTADFGADLLMSFYDTKDFYVTFSADVERSAPNCPYTDWFFLFHFGKSTSENEPSTWEFVYKRLKWREINNFGSL